MAKSSIQARATSLTQVVLQQADVALYLADAKYVFCTVMSVPCKVCSRRKMPRACSFMLRSASS